MNDNHHREAASMAQLSTLQLEQLITHTQFPGTLNTCDQWAMRSQMNECERKISDWYTDPAPIRRCLVNMLLLLSSWWNVPRKHLRGQVEVSRQVLTLSPRVNVPLQLSRRNGHLAKHMRVLTTAGLLFLEQDWLRKHGYEKKWRFP